MIKIAIVEDDNECAELLQQYTDRCCAETGEIIQMVRFTDGDEIASDYSAERDKNVIIVFITSMAQYAIRGYAVDALSFLLKPLKYFTFSQELKRCIERIRRKKKKFLLFSTENGMDRIATEEILYIESLNHKMLITTDAAQYSVYDTMRNMEEVLKGEGFARCNNCYLVNLAYVTAVRGEYVLLGERKLKISRHKRKAFLEALTEKFAAR